MKPTMTHDLVLDALMMALWCRKRGQDVIVHSDQGCQFTSSDWQSLSPLPGRIPFLLVREVLAEHRVRAT
ncbi:hypothetical protein J7J50_02785 [Lysobacter sp. ISL-50]|nr:hypothetical protein [Lysobacter sp. ISL-50]MBT2775374.1 hypothetical protein [Lysobacter sp. ISL-54]MBT2783497.1 hypothetical protein [Lysobacter sp. ISL-52]